MGDWGGHQGCPPLQGTQDTPEDGIVSCNCVSVFHLQMAQEKHKNQAMDVRLKNNNELGLHGER